MRYLLLCALFCISFLLPAYGEAEPLRVALLLDSAAEDHGRNALLKEGLARAARQCELAADIIVAAEGETQLTVFEEAARSHDLVLLAAPSLHAILRSKAANFRKTSFGCIDTSILGLRSANIMSVTFADAEPAFLAGAAAALLIPSGAKLGWLEEEASPQNQTMLEGFLAGALVSRPDIRMVRRELQGAAPAQLLQEMEQEGVRLVLLATGSATPKACAALAATSLLAVGLDKEQSSLAPGRVPFSVVKRFDKAVEELVLARANGTFKGRETRVYNLENKGTALVRARDYALPANVQRRLAELERELLAGNIVLQDRRTPTLCNCLD